MLIAGLLRHCGGFTWGYNQNPYFDSKTDSKNYLLVLASVPVISGVIGTTTGGAITGFLRRSKTFPGIKSSLLVLGVCNCIAAPGMALMLYYDTPYSYYFLFTFYIFAETWFGIYLIAVSELFKPEYRGGAIGYTIFLLRLVAGSLPGLILSPLKASLGYFWALIIMVPGMYFLAALVWLFLFFSMPSKHEI